MKPDKSVSSFHVSLTILREKHIQMLDWLVCTSVLSSFPHNESMISYILTKPSTA